MLSELLERDWDVVVIGAGLGGGTAGRRLSELGFSVLFLEKGPSGVVGQQNNQDESQQFWGAPVHARIDGKDHRLSNVIGTGVGGSSLLYAASLERPERSDLEDSASRPHPTGGWPVTYDALAPYFSEAERLFSVRGTPDLLSSDVASLLQPAPLDDVDSAMADSFTRFGLHPYQVHQALRDSSGCMDCFGRVCPRGCKMDGRTAGVAPALASGNSALLDQCTVLAIRGEPNRVTHLEIERRGERATIRAKRYILASGGFGSPQILLASASEHWPNGCGNSSGLVGRNLMFHLLESIAIWPQRRFAPSVATKSLTFRDLYFHEGKRYGVLQSSGLNASYGEVLHAFRLGHGGSLFGPNGLLRKALNFPIWLAMAYLGNARVYRAIIEDLPYVENRVIFDKNNPSRIAFEYTVPAELRDRRHEFRSLLKKRARLPMQFLTSEIELDISHACGTLRFGNDAKSSVLNADCRFHDIDNLYAADASYMPTSCGVNPGLLIAANALRVADAVADHLGRPAKLGT